MELPVQITFRDTPESDSIKSLIEEECQKLDHFFPRILSCHVSLEVPHRHKTKGKLYEVRVDLTIPGHELVANRVPAERVDHEDAYAAVRHAFKQVRRQLQECVRIRRAGGQTHLGRLQEEEPVPLASNF